jgi:hypothetical protein
MIALSAGRNLPAMIGPAAAVPADGIEICVPAEGANLAEIPAQGVFRRSLDLRAKIRQIAASALKQSLPPPPS